jgi:hypothetical protein
MREENPYLNQKFDFNEIVVIHSTNQRLITFNNKRGYVVGKLSPDDYQLGDSRDIVYSIRIEGVRECWCIAEEDIESTGLFMNNEIMETWELGQDQYRFRDK